MNRFRGDKSQGKCRDPPEDEQMQEEIGLEMFESVPGNIVDHDTATPPPPVGFKNLNQIASGWQWEWE
jgi:hypothetical protein